MIDDNNWVIFFPAKKRENINTKFDANKVRVSSLELAKSKNETVTRIRANFPTI